MADIHVVGESGDGYRVVMHFAVPVGNNAVNVPWAAAFLNSRGTLASALSDGDGTNGTITATEKADVAARTVIEHTVKFRLESGGTSTAELRVSLRAFYQSEKTNKLAALQRELKYFGHTEAGA